MPRSQNSPELTAKGRRLADALRAERDRLGIGQEPLARRAEISVETVRRIERHLTPNPGFFTVAALATALEISLDSLAESAAE